jgi:hypothetical protein
LTELPISSPLPHIPSKSISIINLKKTSNIPALKANLLTSWSTFQPTLGQLGTQPTPDLIIDYLSNSVTKIMQENLAYKTVNCERSLRPNFWLSKEARMAKHFKRRCERRYRPTLRIADLTTLLQAKSRLNTLVISSRSCHFSKVLASSKGNPKRVWRTLNSMLCRRQPLLPPSNILAENFAAFFSSKVARLQGLISSELRTLKAPIDPMFADLPLTRTEFMLNQPSITDVITAVNACSAPVSLNEFSDPKLYSICLDEITEPINALMQSIFSTGLFPSSLRTSLVFPLLKNASMELVVLNNYRPVSNLPFISKVFERLLIAQL